MNGLESQTIIRSVKLYLSQNRQPRAHTRVNKHSCTTMSGCLRVWRQKMPSQIEIANSLRRTDIFQLAAHKGQPPHLKAKSRGRWWRSCGHY